MLPATFVDCADIKEAAELALVYSSNYAKITQQGLLEFVKNFDLDFPDMANLLNIPEFDDIAFIGKLNEIEGVMPGEKITPSSLKDSFIFPPFSVLDTRSGAWQERKRKWLELGFKKERERYFNTFIVLRFINNKVDVFNLGVSHDDEYLEFLNSINYVHQLQNLHFALTHRELTVA